MVGWSSLSHSHSAATASTATPDEAGALVRALGPTCVPQLLARLGKLGSCIPAAQRPSDI